MAELVATAQAAAILNVTKVTVSRWVTDGLLTPAVRLPGRNGAMLFKRIDVERLAAKRQAISRRT